MSGLMNMTLSMGQYRLRKKKRIQKEQNRKKIVEQGEDAEQENDKIEGKEENDVERIIKRESKIPSRFQDYEMYYAYSCLLTEVSKDYQEAVKSVDWSNAIDKELLAHDKYKTWEPSILPNDKKAIDTK